MACGRWIRWRPRSALLSATGRRRSGSCARTRSSWPPRRSGSLTAEDEADVEAAFWPAAHVQLGAVRGADGLGDRQAEAHAAVAAFPDPAERFGQRGHGTGRHHGPAVGDVQHGAAWGPAGRDADPAARLVVPDRVVDEVPDHALDELLMAGRLGRPDVRLLPQPQLS